MNASLQGTGVENYCGGYFPPIHTDCSILGQEMENPAAEGNADCKVQEFGDVFGWNCVECRVLNRQVGF